MLNENREPMELPNFQIVLTPLVLVVVGREAILVGVQGWLRWRRDISRLLKAIEI